jgi:hypothetical protein
MAPRINYVVSSWHGPRTFSKPNFERYGWYAIQKNLECLSKLKHRLGQVTVVAPTDKDGTWPPDYEAYLNSLAVVGGTTVKVIKRENGGYSYENWRQAYLADPSFDYYVFIEDDWCPVHDDFDSILVDMLADRPVYLCGYVCFIINQGPRFKSAAHSNGIISAKSMTKVAAMGPFKDQNHFSRSLVQVGLDIVDWRDRYRSPFFHDLPGIDLPGVPRMEEYSQLRKEYLIVPVQLIMVPEMLKRFVFIF